MNQFSWMIIPAGLAIFSGLAMSQETVPEKFRNASPELRAAHGLPPTDAKPGESVDIGLLRSLAGRDGPTCATVKVSAPVKFRNRTLVEIPDIREPQLRLANQLMSAGCFARAVDQLEIVTRADPANLHAQYIVARMSWMKVGAPVGEMRLKQTLKSHPDFVSAKVLLAHIRFGQNKVAESAALLDDAERRSPTDLWVYLGKLRIEALSSPTADLRVRLFEIMRNPAFPPNAREGAADMAKLLPLSEPQYEELLRARLDIDSNLGMACKASELAFWLGEHKRQFAEVIKLLDSPRAKQGNCLGLEKNRTLLAQAYLMEAAKIHAGPSPANQHLVSRADQILNSDYTSLAAHAQVRPQYAQLKPFLDAFVHPEEEDGHGVTKLCHAIGQLNVALVRQHLEAGADPNGRCRSESLVGSLVYMATRDKKDERREIMRALLEHGAPVTNLDACRSPNMGDCAQVLLPVMEKFAKPAK